MPFVTGSDPGTSTVCYQLVVPDDLYFRAAVRGVLEALTDSENWEQVGAATPAEYAALAQTMYDNFIESAC